MELKIVEKKEQPLVKRTEVIGKVKFKGETTPSNQIVAQKIADDLKSDVNNVVMKKINTHFGSSEAVFTAEVYKDAAAKKRFVPITKKMKEAAKKAEEEAKKKAEEAKAAAEAAKAEKPAEPAAEEAKPAEPAPAEEKPAEAKPAEQPAEPKPEEAKTEEKSE